MKKLILSLMVPLALGASASIIKNGATLHQYTLPAGWVNSMSDNGQWAVWQPYSYGETDAKVTILDIVKGKMIELPLTDQEQAEEGVARMCDVTNDGKTVVGFLSMQPAYYRDGIWTRLPLHTGMRRWEGELTCVSADGKVMAGWINNAWEYWRAVIYKQNADGEYDLIPLDKFPTYESLLLADVISEGAYNAAIAEYGDGALPNLGCHGISGDGKWVVMSVNRNQEGINGYFLFNTETEEPVFINGKLNREFAMSNNGRYLLVNGAFDLSGEEAGNAYVLDRETGEKRTTVIGTDGNGSTIDNLGNVYFEKNAAPVGGLRGTLCMHVDGVDVALSDVLKQKYGIDFFAETGYEATGYAVTVSDDRKTFVAMPSMVMDAYSLTLPETFDKAFQGINVLQEWQASPAAGLKLAHLSTVAVKLSRDADIKSGAKAYIKEGDKTVAETDKIAYGSTTSKSLFRIDFPEQTFEPGKSYTVVIPAGTFYLSGTTSETPEMTITYQGREDGPVQVSQVTPKDGADVSCCDISNAFGIRFSTDIMLGNPETRAAIYEKGTTSPLTSLEAVIQDRMLILYAPSIVYLRKGVEYEVRVPANMVTDPAGFCGNEAMTLTYSGIYEPQSQSGLFFEDFNQPNQARGNFIYFEGDHRQPVESMVELGFDVDNNPWNFTIHDEDNFDYCAASHSMYTPAGKSDDWMAINQFNIVGKTAYMSFKAQSFKKTAKDRLKIYVWECEDKYGALTEDIVAKIRKDGVLVFDELLTPGAEENKLEGDWSEYRVELGQFDKKKVYICFLNENDNQSAIFVDDILVDSEGSYTGGARLDTHVIALDEIEVPAMITSRNDKGNLKHIKAVLTNTTNGFTSTYESDIDLAKDEKHEFVFPEKMKLEKGVANYYTIAFDVDDEGVGANGVIKNLTKELNKMVVIEETTGAWCGNCPMGVIAMEEIEKRNPGKLLGIAVHDGDSYAQDDYSQFLATGGDPNGRVNRSSQIVHPMPDGMNLVSPTGDQSWYDLFLKELASPAECEIKVNKAIFSPEEEQMQAFFDVEFGLNAENLYYNVFTVVLEDQLPISQHNYFSNPAYDGYEIFGEWRSTGSLGSHGEYARTEANHVARGIAGLSYNGESGFIPREVEAGKLYSGMTTFAAPQLREAVPAKGEEMKNVSIACIIIDATTGKVVNANVHHGVEIGMVGVDDIASETVENIIFKVIGGTVYANGSAENVEVYSIQGQRVANEGLSGLFIVRAFDESGNSRVEKIAIR